MFYRLCQAVLSPIVLICPWLSACSPESRLFHPDRPWPTTPSAPPTRHAASSPPALPSPTAQTLAQHIHTHCWITYTPTAFDPSQTPLVWPSRASVQADLAALRHLGVEGLVTYRSFFYEASPTSADTSADPIAARSIAANPNTVDPIAPSSPTPNPSPPNPTPPPTPQHLPLVDLAAQAGFKAMVIGIWDPSSEAELAAAEALGPEPLVWGYSVGNEGLGQRYDGATLTAAIDRLRQATGKPVATTEETPDYFQNSALQSTGDWIFANVHPYFAGIRDPDRAAAWTARLYLLFQQLEPASPHANSGHQQRPVVFKEVGLPTAGAKNVSEAQQAAYYQALRQTDVTYVNFAAFDLPWKQHTGQAATGNPDSQPLGNTAGTLAQPPTETLTATPPENPEPYWGVLRADRSPKPAAQFLCSPRQDQN